jgi:hypothetical protein
MSSPLSRTYSAATYRAIYGAIRSQVACNVLAAFFQPPDSDRGVAAFGNLAVHHGIAEGRQSTQSGPLPGHAMRQGRITENHASPIPFGHVAVAVPTSVAGEARGACRMPARLPLSATESVLDRHDLPATPARRHSDPAADLDRSSTRLRSAYSRACEFSRYRTEAPIRNGISISSPG